MVLSDPHSPAQMRVNGAVRNVDAWYTAFNVQLASRGARFVRSGDEPGLLYREHDGPRLSRIKPAAFALACADNATRAYRLWSEAGTLTDERRSAIAATMRRSAASRFRRVSSITPAMCNASCVRGARARTSA